MEVEAVGTGTGMGVFPGWAAAGMVAGMAAGTVVGTAIRARHHQRVGSHIQ